MSNLTRVQEFVTKLLSGQSANCMIQYFNNLPIPKLPNTNVQPIWVQLFVTKLLSGQSANCMVTKFNNPPIPKLPNTNVQQTWEWLKGL